MQDVLTNPGIWLATASIITLAIAIWVAFSRYVLGSVDLTEKSTGDELLDRVNRELTTAETELEIALTLYPNDELVNDLLSNVESGKVAKAIAEIRHQQCQADAKSAPKQTVRELVQRARAIAESELQTERSLVETHD